MTTFKIVDSMIANVRKLKMATGDTLVMTTIRLPGGSDVVLLSLDEHDTLVSALARKNNPMNVELPFEPTQIVLTSRQGGQVALELDIPKTKVLPPLEPPVPAPLDAGGNVLPPPEPPPEAG